MKKKETNNKDNEEVIAEKIKLLWAFIWSLKPYRERFKEIAEQAEGRAETAIAAAVLNPLGWEVNEKKHRRVARRAKLLVKMIDCLEETDKEVAEAEKEKADMERMSKTLDF